MLHIQLDDTHRSGTHCELLIGGISVITLEIFLTELILLSDCPFNKMFDQPFMVGCPVSITFHKHQHQTNGVFL